jgi:hypothetical protein
MNHQRLCDVLISQSEKRGELTHANDIREATATYYSSDEPRYGEYLLKEQIVTPTELSLGLAVQATLDEDYQRADHYIREAEALLNRYRDEADSYALQLRQAEVGLCALDNRLAYAGGHTR